MKIIKEEKKKKSPKHAWGWFVHPNKGDPETMNRFNNSVNFNAASPDGGNVTGGDGAGASGGVGESLEEDIGMGYSRQQLFAAIKEFGVKYKLDKYTNQQLYRILNRLNQEKIKQDKMNQEYQNKKSITTNKRYDDDNKYEYLGTVDGKKLYYNKETSEYGVEGYKVRFASEEDAADFVRQ